MEIEIIALVGRPNVGKSTLFNRLSRNNKAIVNDKPGVTRDRKYGNASLGGREFIVIDTPGLEESEEGKLEERMMQQTLLAVKEADLVCLIIDAKQGVTPADKFFAHFVRKNAKKFIVIANKCEKSISFDKEYLALNGQLPVAISSEHNLGMMGLYDVITENLDQSAEVIKKAKYKENSIVIQPEFEYDAGQVSTMPKRAKSDKVDKFKSIDLAIVGRPNAGKSTFINAVLGEDRLLVGPEAGITRESITIEWSYKNFIFKLVDTAGLRKKRLINDKLEQLSAADTINTIRYANIVVLMLDASLGLEHQDLSIAGHVIEEGRGLVLVINKADLIPDINTFQKDVVKYISSQLAYIEDIPLLFISALTNKNINAVFDTCIKVYTRWNEKIPTHKLNKWLTKVSEKHPLPLLFNGRRVRIKYMNQSKIRPPTFQLFTNEPSKIPESYLRYLANNLREEFDLVGIPIRFTFKKIHNPYV